MLRENRVEEKHKKKIEEIMAEMECEKDFECYKSEFNDICKAKNSGIYSYVDCLEEMQEARLCQFSLSFGEGFLCKCPLRVYIAKNLKI
jgi:hypothetical protein